MARCSVNNALLLRPIAHNGFGRNKREPAPSLDSSNSALFSSLGSPHSTTEPHPPPRYSVTAHQTGCKSLFGHQRSFKSQTPKTKEAPSSKFQTSLGLPSSFIIHFCFS